MTKESNGAHNSNQINLYIYLSRDNNPSTDTIKVSQAVILALTHDITTQASLSRIIPDR
jgi:hypothetical protein